MVLGLEFEAKGRTPPSTNPKHCTLPLPSEQTRLAVAVPNQTQHGPKVKQHLRESLFPFISRFEEFTSVKISNNALNFLLAQYRAIFKRAYVKGIASAVILTAGLAAGQAQAASEAGDYYIQDTSANWTIQGGFRNEWPAASGGTVAGAYEDKRAPNGSSDGKLDGQLSGGLLVVGASGTTSSSKDQADIGKANIAMGAYLYSTGNTTISDFVVNDNQISLLSGGTVDSFAQGAWVEVDKGNINASGNKAVVEGGTVGSHIYGANLKTGDGNITATENTANITGGTVSNSAYGVFANATKGNVTANTNSVIFDLDAGAQAAVQAKTATTDGIFGARIKTEDGNAFASGNYVDITVDKDPAATLTLGNGGNGIVGALAEGTDSVSVTGNRVNITVEGDTAKISGTVYSIQGGFALNQTDGKEASTLTADSNSVTATGLNLASTSGTFIFGGRAMQDNNASGAATDLVARNNKVSLTNTNVINNATDVKALQVIGNIAFANPGTAPTGTQNSVSAIGDGTTDNVYVEGGNFSYTKASGLGSGPLNPNSMIAGGYAQTVSGGGNAVANLNKATIKSITGTNVNLYGGVATSDKSAEGDQVSASQNTLSVDAITLSVDSDTAKSYTKNYIVGGIAALGDQVTKAAATASNNTVTVTNSTYSKANSEKLIILRPIAKS